MSQAPQPNLATALGGARVLGARRPDLAAAIRAGLPVTALEHVAENLALEPAEQARVLAVSVRTLQRLGKQRGRLDAAASDRLVRLARIYTDAAWLFEDDDKAARWLRAANPALDGEAPLALLDTDVGTRRVEAVLDRLQHGIYT